MKAAEYIQTELIKREMEREKRDREFWIAAFGGEAPLTERNEDVTLEETMSRSALGNH